jgi:hypothetical protein
MADRQNCTRKNLLITHGSILSEGANSAKEDKNCMQDAGPVLPVNYSKIILVLIKRPQD